MVEVEPFAVSSGGTSSVASGAHSMGVNSGVSATAADAAAATTAARGVAGAAASTSEASIGPPGATYSKPPASGSNTTAHPPQPVPSGGVRHVIPGPQTVASPSLPGGRPQSGPPSPAPRRTTATAVYVDFENLYFGSREHHHALSIPRIARQLNRLSRAACGQGWAQTGVYANWDAIVPTNRHAQDDWAMLGWRTVAIPTREDYVSQRIVKNLVDFVMSLDMLEDARDRPFDHFFIVSGDKDFCEVAERLKRLGKRVSVVALKPDLSWRLREAADDYVVWSFEEISGDEPLPMQSYRHLTAVVSTPGRTAAEDPFQVLLRAVRMAERDQGVAPVLWTVVRDEYFLRMTEMPGTEADRFVRSLATAGFVNLASQRMRDGTTRTYVSIPR